MNNLSSYVGIFYETFCNSRAEFFIKNKIAQSILKVRLKLEFYDRQLGNITNRLVEHHLKVELVDGHRKKIDIFQPESLIFLAFLKLFN